MAIRLDFIITADESGALPPFTGEYVRSWFLSTVKIHNAELFRFLHDCSGPKPYAIRPLRPIRKGMSVIGGYWRVYEGDKLTFSISVLRDDIKNNVLEAISDNENVKFGTILCQLNQIKEHELRYDEPLEKLGHRIGLIFRTPTFFNIRGRAFPFLYPDPIRVLSNLSTIWNAFAPRELKIDQRQFIAWVSKSIMVKSHRLFTREVEIKNIKLTGFKGRVEWIIIDNAMEGIVTNLLKYAEFSNVGEKRTYGLGVVNYYQLDKT